MDDKANLAYAALPERLYVIQEGKITYEVSLVTMRLFREDNAWSFREELGLSSTASMKWKTFFPK